MHSKRVPQENMLHFASVKFCDSTSSLQLLPSIIVLDAPESIRHRTGTCNSDHAVFTCDISACTRQSVTNRRISRATKVKLNAGFSSDKSIEKGVLKLVYTAIMTIIIYLIDVFLRRVAQRVSKSNLKKSIL